MLLFRRLDARIHGCRHPAAQLVNARACLLHEAIRALPKRGDRLARALARGTGPGTGVAVVPGSSFFHDPADGRKLVRFSFCKRMETLEEAARRLEALAPVLGRDGETAR